jgi:hypothetical protein
MQCTLAYTDVACYAESDASNASNNTGTDGKVAASKPKAARLVDFSNTPMDIAQVYNQKAVMVGHDHAWTAVRVL